LTGSYGIDISGNAATATSATSATNATNATNATTATNATQLNGQAASYYTNASNLDSGTLPSGRLTGSYGISISGNAATATSATTASNALAIADGSVSTAAKLGAGVVSYDKIAILTGALTFRPAGYSIQSDTGYALTLLSGQSDGQGVPMYVLDTSNTISTGKLFSVKNKGTEKFFVDKDGGVSSSGTLTGSAIESTVTGQNAPFVVASTYLVSNLNADLLDGYQGSAFARLAPAAVQSSGGTYGLWAKGNTFGIKGQSTGAAGTWAIFGTAETGVQGFLGGAAYGACGYYNDTNAGYLGGNGVGVLGGGVTYGVQGQGGNLRGPRHGDYLWRLRLRRHCGRILSR